MGDNFGRFAYLVPASDRGQRLSAGRIAPTPRQDPCAPPPPGADLSWRHRAGGLWPDIRNTIRPRPRILDGNRIEVPVGNDGHYQLTAQVNGVNVRFVIDTGASSIALGPATPSASASIGKPRLYRRAQTANGTVQTAPVRLDSVAIGDIATRACRPWCCAPIWTSR